jgi:hypothetical protein
VSDERPEHIPVGDPCTKVLRDGEKCRLPAWFHRPPRKRKRSRKGQKSSKKATALHAQWTAYQRDYREAERLTRPKRKRIRGIGPQTECECGVWYKDHTLEYPHVAEGCTAFRAKMRKAEPLVSCRWCQVQFYAIEDLDQHLDVEGHPERWGPCKGWRKQVASCVNCRGKFYRLKSINKHTKLGECKKL